MSNKSPSRQNVILTVITVERDEVQAGLNSLSGFAIKPFAELIDPTAAQAAQPLTEERLKPGEPLQGAAAMQFAAIVEAQPVLMIFDLDDRSFNWKRWLSLLQSSPATRRMPIIAFADRPEAYAEESPVSRGVAQLFQTDHIRSELPQVVQRFAKAIDFHAIEDACQEPLSALGRKGLHLFNEGEYFESHELLEDAWNEDQGAGRELYRAVLQIAVAYLQIERGNYNGAVKMMLRVKQWIDPLPDRCRGINIAKLRADAEAVHAALISLGKERIGEFDTGSFRPVEYETSD